MTQLLANIKARQSRFGAWWAREGRGMATGVIVVMVAWLGYQQIQLWSVSNHASSASQHASTASQHAAAASQRASATAAASCESTKVMAEIASDTLATQITNSRALLPKISFPGLTHRQLVELTEQKESEERRHLARLEAVARKTCPVQP